MQELYSGFDEPAENVVVSSENNEESDEETTSLYNVRKLQEAKPFLVLRGVKENSQSINKIIRLSFQEDNCYMFRSGYLKEGRFVEEERKVVENGFEFGRDWVFMDETANTGAIVFFVPMKGWFIKSLDIDCWAKSKSQTLVSVPTYDKIQAQSDSNPVVLEEGMVIHTEGYSFLIGSQKGKNN